MAPGETDAGRSSDRVPWWWSTVAQVTILSGIALLCGAPVRSRCILPPPPVDRPLPGTPFAGYCDAINGHAPWLLLVIAPVGICVVGLVLLRRRPAIAWILVLITVVILAANTAYAFSLDYNYPSP